MFSRASAQTTQRPGIVWSASTARWSTLGRPAKRLADQRCKQLNSQLTLNEYEEKNEATWKDAREKYTRLVLPESRAERTRQEILDTLDRFERLVHPRLLRDVSGETVLEFRRLRQAEKGRGGRLLSPATVNKDLRNLRTFFNAMADEDVLDLIPRAPKIRMLPEVDTEKPFYTEDEFVGMYQACEIATMPRHLGTCPARLWWRAFLCCLWETGARRGELLSLTWDNVHLAEHYIRPAPVTTKTKRFKEYAFGKLAEDQLKLLRDHSADRGGRVFPWPHDPSRLNQQLARIQKVAGIDPNRADLKIHAFRRTVGNTMAELYGLDAAQHKLGHTTPAVTAKHYVQAAMRSKAKKSVMPIPAALIAREAGD